jgi:uncharacterized coiled-coil DUF342 family protein
LLEEIADELEDVEEELADAAEEGRLTDALKARLMEKRARLLAQVQELMERRAELLTRVREMLQRLGQESESGEAQCG